MLFRNPNPKILITQPYTPGLKASYEKLSTNYGADIQFQSFTENKLIPVPLFRKYKYDILKYTALVFTNKIAIDSFFSLSKACNIEIPTTKKYFFLTEPLQKYIRKYIDFKKRCVFHGHKTFNDLFPIIAKHKKESFLMPCSGSRKGDIKNFCDKKGYFFKEMVIYETEPSKLETLDVNQYDIIVFFSPITVEAFASNFPTYQQGNTKIATFNNLTAEMVDSFGWKNNIHAPTSTSPSLPAALDQYLKSIVG